jgi:hypothetical protein
MISDTNLGDAGGGSEVTVDREFLLKALLSHNYLPTTRRAKEELPPCFNSLSFTPEIARILVQSEYRKGKDNGGYSGYDQVEYQLTRFNSVARLLSVPHPLPYAKLCMALSENWDKLEFISQNSSSRIKPQLYEDGRVIIMNGYSDSVEKANHQLDDAFGMRYRVTADIANCFPSIYSHAVPWALVGFNEAKAQRGNALWFNQIDKHLRACKRDETQGVAIGPATSNIVAEAILARIDEKLSAQGFRFERYIDDYSCHAESEEKAQAFVRALGLEAATYKLQLNIKKTKFTRLPEPVNDSWIVELSRHLPNDAEWSSSDAFRYLDFAVALAESHPEASVIKYAANVVSNAKVAFMAHDEILNYLLMLAFYRPELLPVLSGLIEQSYFLFFGQFIDWCRTLPKLNVIVQEHALQHRSDGMCWGLFYLARHPQGITEDTANAVIKTEDALALLTLYWSCETYHEPIIRFCSVLDKSDLYLLDRYWMLLFQLYSDGKIENPYNETVFECLKQNGVSFLLSREECFPKSVVAGVACTP